MDGGNGNSGGAQQAVRVAASGSPQGIENHFQSRGVNQLEVDDRGETREVGWLGIDGLRGDMRRSSGRGLTVSGNQSLNRRGNVGKRGGAIGRGELDAVVLGRIMG